MNEIIKLVKEIKTVGASYEEESARTERTLFAEVRSIGQSEFYQAQGVGMKPELKFIIADYLDYENEQKLLYMAYNEAEEQEYTIIRTYRNGNTLEITCNRGID